MPVSKHITQPPRVPPRTGASIAAGARATLPKPTALDAVGLLRALHGSLQPDTVAAAFYAHLEGRFGLRGCALEFAGFSWGTGERSELSSEHPLYDNESKAGRITFFGERAFNRLQRAELGYLVGLCSEALRNAIRHAELEQQAREDALTGLLNRRALDSMLPREIALAERARMPLSLVLIDIDNFKRINDTWGHVAGDRVLRDLSEALRVSVRRSDLAFRLGGEEFLLLLPETDARGARTVADRVRRALEGITQRQAAEQRPELAGGVPTFSAGIAERQAGIDAAVLLQLADRAMYRAKRGGRNRSCVALAGDLAAVAADAGKPAAAPASCA